MKLTNLLNDSDDSRAVSPVIGVILMVAITVILAAVIGTFVLGLGDSVESAPQASTNFDYVSNNDDGNGEVTIRHRGGDTLETDNIGIRVNGEAVDDSSVYINDLSGSTLNDGNQEFNAGNRLVIEDGGTAPLDVFNEGDEISIVFTDAERQSILGSFEIPEDSNNA